MNSRSQAWTAVLLAFAATLVAAGVVRGEVRAWEDTIAIPTYPWEEDINPKFWALEGATRLSTTVSGSITYPYPMQDHLSRTKTDRTYKALCLENEYLKVICLPELGGRLHSVYDKTQKAEVFHRNNVIKPGMIAMRGAFISGGVEWNAGPQVHTVTIVSPVDALVGHNSDGSAYLEVNNIEKIFRTRWTVRVTLHPGRKYLDEQIRLYNPTDGMHPYYFWNCTAQPNLPGTRFIYPMSLGTDHHGREFFRWPIHEGKDLSWLKNYETWASVFSVGCEYDFFGSYHVDLDRGCVQVANRHLLPGKKAWTWGTWDFGLVSQQNLTDDDGPYIEVQSGPLPTQSDYGMLDPRHEVAWQEWWYPVHGLGEGFEYATRDIAVQSVRSQGDLELRINATGRFLNATCRLEPQGQAPQEHRLELSPDRVSRIICKGAADIPVQVLIAAQGGRVLAQFTTPLPIPKVEPPDPATFAESRDDELSVEQKYLKGRRYDRSTSRSQARRYYELALADDPGYVPALRALAVLDLEAGLYDAAKDRLTKALARDSDDGLAWYFLGVCHLRQGDLPPALECGYRAARYADTRSAGRDLAGRVLMRMGDPATAVREFGRAMRNAPHDTRARDHWLLAQHAARQESVAENARATITRFPTDLVPRAVLGLQSDEAARQFAADVRSFAGEYEFEVLETSLVLAEVGLFAEAARLVRAALVDGVDEKQRSPLPVYYLAYLLSKQQSDTSANDLLRQAAAMQRDFVFPSRPEEVEILEFALRENPADANAHLHLGNLLANLGRVDEALSHWQAAAKRDPSLSIAQRNLGLAAATRDSDLPRAAEYYRRAIAARPADQTLYRDLAEILIADQKRPEAIRLLETMPVEGQRRSEIIITLAQAYLDEERFTDTLDLLAATPYFVNWEGQDITWRLFHRANLRRGQQRMDKGDYSAALKDFEAALTYPENLGVGRSNKPQHAEAEYWRGKALAALGRNEEAQSAWRAGAAGADGRGVQNEFRQRCREALQGSE